VTEAAAPPPPPAARPEPSPPPPAKKPSQQSTPPPAASAPAQAPLPDVPPLKALIAAGVQLYEKGDYDGAIRAFTYGYALRPKPLFLFNIAQAYRKSGQDMNALAFYEKFQLAAPTSPYRAETQAYISYLRVRLGFEPAPRPAVKAGPAPVYKRGWFWVTIIGVAALAAGGIALGTILGSDSGPQTTLGIVDPRFIHP
jgi:hypothetical protein